LCKQKLVTTVWTFSPKRNQLMTVRHLKICHCDCKRVRESKQRVSPFTELSVAFSCVLNSLRHLYDEIIKTTEAVQGAYKWSFSVYSTRSSQFRGHFGLFNNSTLSLSYSNSFPVPRERRFETFAIKIIGVRRGISGISEKKRATGKGVIRYINTLTWRAKSNRLTPKSIYQADPNVQNITPKPAVMLRGRSIYVTCSFIILLAPWAGKMNQILRCDWLPERARWSYLARSGLPAVSYKKHFPESHVINPLFTKLVRSRWLDIGLVLSLRVYGLRLPLGP